jgi:hypothetical protein
LSVAVQTIACVPGVDSATVPVALPPLVVKPVTVTGWPLSVQAIDWIPAALAAETLTSTGSWEPLK